MTSPTELTLEELRQLPRSRSAAWTRASATGKEAPLYFTGEECEHGHLAAKYTCNKTCVVCEAERNQRNQLERSQALQFKMGVSHYQHKGAKHHSLNTFLNKKMLNRLGEGPFEIVPSGEPDEWLIRAAPNGKRFKTYGRTAAGVYQLSQSLNGAFSHIPVFGKTEIDAWFEDGIVKFDLRPDDMNQIIQRGPVSRKKKEAPPVPKYGTGPLPDDSLKQVLRDLKSIRERTTDYDLYAIIEGGEAVLVQGLQWRPVNARIITED